MGAAGLTSSSAEMAARGDVGVTIDTTKVPVRETGHDAVRDPAQRVAGAHARRRASADASDEVAAILAKWDLTAAVIGEVIAEPVYRVTEGDRVVAEFPGTRLVTDCPTYTPDARESETIRDAPRARRERDRRAAGGARSALDARAAALVADDREQDVGVPAIRHHRAHQHRRRPAAATPPSCACAAPTARSRSRRTATGATSISIRASARASPSREAARNVACTGARPMAITNNLNFGNPRRPEVFFQFREAVARHGARRATRSARRSPAATSRSTTRAPAARCIPTPVIGMVGVVESLAHVTRAPSATRATRSSCSASRPIEHRRERVSVARPRRRRGRAAAVRPRRERELIDALLEAIERGVIESAHDCSDGGLASPSRSAASWTARSSVGATVDLAALARPARSRAAVRRGAGACRRQHGVAGRRARHRRATTEFRRASSARGSSASFACRFQRSRRASSRRWRGSTPRITKRFPGSWPSRRSPRSDSGGEQRPS